MIIQSVLLSKQHFHTREDAKKWIEKHGFKSSISPDPNPESKNLWRFRQRQPSEFMYGTFKTLIHDEKGVGIVVGRLKLRHT